MALQFARDLGVAAELVPVARQSLDGGLDSRVCDIVMSGAAITADRALDMQFSTPYLDETLAFIVLDHMAAAFSDWSTIRSMGTLRIGVPRAPYYIQKIRDELKDVEIVPIDRMDDMFARRDSPRRRGSSPQPSAGRRTRCCIPSTRSPCRSRARSRCRSPMSSRTVTRRWLSIVNTWIELKRKDGTIDELFAHWILGQDNASKAPRWSIARERTALGPVRQCPALAGFSRTSSERSLWGRPLIRRAVLRQYGGWRSRAR